MIDAKIKRSVETAQLLKSVLHKLLVSEQGLHAETLVAASARMAGTLLLRHLVPEVDRLQPGEVVISDAVDRHGPILTETLLVALRHLGEAEVDQESLRQVTATAELSRLSLVETQTLLEPWYRKIVDATGQTLLEVSASAAMTTAMVIHDCRDVLDVASACAIAVDALVEATKTVPARLDVGA